MIGCIISFIAGGFAGALVMALCAASKNSNINIDLEDTGERVCKCQIFTGCNTTDPCTRTSSKACNKAGCSRTTRSNYYQARKKERKVGITS